MKKIIYNLIIVITLLSLFSCSMNKSDDSDNSNNGLSRAGSLARFNVVNDYLYTVTPSALNTLNLADVERPVKVAINDLNFYTETIFPYENNLLLGTENGMYIFSINQPNAPLYKTFFSHVRSCDPVVAQDGYAYITLSNNKSRCWSGTNMLQILDITDFNNIVLKKELDLVNPQGLDINNDTLFVCDEGIKIIDVSDKSNPIVTSYISNVKARDIIYHNGIIIVTGDDGIKQYKFVNNNLELISSINSI